MIFQNIKQKLSSCMSLAQTKSRTMDKKGNFNMMSNTAKGLITFGIILVMGVAITIGVRDTFTSGSAEYNEANEIVVLFTDLRTWAGIILLVIIGYIVMRYMGMFGE